MGTHERKLRKRKRKGIPFQKAPKTPTRVFRGGIGLTTAAEVLAGIAGIVVKGRL